MTNDEKIKLFEQKIKLFQSKIDLLKKGENKDDKTKRSRKIYQTSKKD